MGQASPSQPKLALSDYVGTLEGRTAIRVFNKFCELKRKPCWGNHFWSKGTCIDRVGLDPTKVHKYVKYQENRDRLQDGQRSLKFD
jgi:putative transposase